MKSEFTIAILFLDPRTSLWVSDIEHNTHASSRHESFAAECQAVFDFIAIVTLDGYHIPWALHWSCVPSSRSSHTVLAHKFEQLLLSAMDTK